MTVGDYSGTNYNIFIRWDNIDIPPGSTILSAHIRWRADTERDEDTKRMVIYFNAADDATAPTTVATANGKAVTTNHIHWTPDDTTTGTWYETPDLADALQEVIDRVGWTENNAVMALIKDDSSTTNARLDICTYDGSSSESAELHVTFS